VAAGAMAPAIRIDTLVYGPINADQARHLVQERRRSASASATPAGAGVS